MEDRITTAVLGTGLMGANDAIVGAVEEAGVTTYTTDEMATMLLALCDIFDPAIWAEMTLPRAKPFGIDRLVGMPRVADIMVAGDRPPADSEFVHQLGGEPEVSFDPGAIGGHIAGMDHEIGMLGRIDDDADVDAALDDVVGDPPR